LFLKLFSLCADEVTDTSGFKQLLVYVFVLDADCKKKKYFLGIVHLSGGTGVHIFSAVKILVEDSGLRLESLVSLATDGAGNFK
jgi:hypothetical protein